MIIDKMHKISMILIQYLFHSLFAKNLISTLLIDFNRLLDSNLIGINRNLIKTDTKHKIIINISL